jgi:two-component system, sensor histidine kinase
MNDNPANRPARLHKKPGHAGHYAPQGNSAVTNYMLSRSISAAGKMSSTERMSAYEGEGSEFTAMFEAEVSGRAAGRSSRQVDSQRPARILIVEDNIDGNETLSFCLKLEGYEVDSAFDGGQGLAMARNGCYDVICCDIGLPVLNGYQVLEQVRLHCLEPIPCCIAMTGYDQLDHRERAARAEFDYFLVKPVSMDALLKIVATRSVMAR